MRTSVLRAVFIVTVLIVANFLRGNAMAADGLITLQSNLEPNATVDRLKTEIKAQGLTVFAHIDHAAGAAAVSLPLRATDVIIFGSAKAGTPLLRSAQTIGIDLPLKVLVWQDAEGRTWLGYNDPKWIAARHGIAPGTEANVAAMATLLDALARKAAALP